MNTAIKRRTVEQIRFDLMINASELAAHLQCALENPQTLRLGAAKSLEARRALMAELEQAVAR